MHKIRHIEELRDHNLVPVISHKFDLLLLSSSPCKAWIIKYCLIFVGKYRPTVGVRILEFESSNLDINKKSGRAEVELWVSVLFFCLVIDLVFERLYVISINSPFVKCHVRFRTVPFKFFQIYAVNAMKEFVTIHTIWERKKIIFSSLLCWSRYRLIGYRCELNKKVFKMTSRVDLNQKARWR